MHIEFFKYQGTGNDFILIDCSQGGIRESVEGLIPALCNRRFGIGSDGVMLIETGARQGVDFEMTYYNPDGSQSFCGNGSRCAVAFAKAHGIMEGRLTRFASNDGMHEAKIEEDGQVALGMNDVHGWQKVDSGIYLHTGSPHLVWFVDDLNACDIEKEGRRWRNNPRFEKAGGCNVNFVEMDGDNLKMRTYERGVEAETLSCGTGVTAAALAASAKEEANGSVDVSTRGGNLRVSFQRHGKEFSDVWLIGPARYVFRGHLNTDDF